MPDRTDPDRTDRTDRTDDRTDSGVRHAGCDHLARPGSRCHWCGTTLPAAAPAAPTPRRRRRAA